MIPKPRVRTGIPEGGRADQKSSTLDYIVADSGIQTVQCTIDENRDLKMESDHVPMIWAFKIEGQEMNISEETWVWNDMKETDWESYTMWAEYKLKLLRQSKVDNNENICYEEIKKTIR